MKYTIIILILSLLFISCEKNVNIKIPDEGRKLTLNSFIYEDSLIKVNLTKSKYILDNTYAFVGIENADISIFEDNNLLGKLDEVSNGNYISTFAAKQNKEYKIEVSGGNLPSVISKSIVPEKTKIESSSVKHPSKNDNYYNTKFKITFQDNPNTEDYYFIELNKRTRYTYYDEELGEDITVEYFNSEYIYSDDLNAYQLGYNMSEGLLLSDEFINGKLYTFTFTTSSGYFEEDLTDTPDDKNSLTYLISLHSISKELFLYYKSYSKYSDSDEMEFFAEPVQVYNNIENGFGIFAGSSVAVDSTTFFPVGK